MDNFTSSALEIYFVTFILSISIRQLNIDLILFSITETSKNCRAESKSQNINLWSKNVIQLNNKKPQMILKHFSVWRHIQLKMKNTVHGFFWAFMMNQTFCENIDIQGCSFFLFSGTRRWLLPLCLSRWCTKTKKTWMLIYSNSWKTGKGQFHQNWAHSVKRKSTKVQQLYKLVNFFSTDDLTGFLRFWDLLA